MHNGPFTMAQTSPFRILAVVFPSFNILDLTGPAEVFGNSRIPPESRAFHIASATETTKAYEGLTVIRDVAYEEVKAEEYDMLLVPGASPQFVLDAIEKDHGLMNIVRKFAEQKDGGGKWLFSVCTGALFLGAAGVLAGRTATTHWLSLETLKEICGKAGGEGETNVVRKRWVDGGKTDGSVRVVNAGGVSCGMDAALWIVSEKNGLDAAKGIAGVMDYMWKYGEQEVETTEGYVV